MTKRKQALEAQEPQAPELTFEKCVVQALRLASELSSKYSHNADLQLSGNGLQLTLQPYRTLEWFTEYEVTESSAGWELARFLEALQDCLSFLNEREQKRVKLEQFLSNLTLEQLQMLNEAETLSWTVKTVLYRCTR